MTAGRDLVAGSGLPRHEAERLLAVAMDTTRARARIADDVGDAEAERFVHLVERRRAGEPLQYLEGDVPFGPIVVAVDERVLIPRPETEELYELVCARAADPSTIVDVCTGSGNLAIALASTHADARVYATDISTDAVDVARRNAAANDVSVEVLHGDLFEPLPRRIAGTVDVVVANPPYLAESEMGDLPEDVRREPVAALVAGPRGDEVLSRIAAEAVEWLAPGGLIACEISEFHGDRARDLFAAYAPDIVADLAGKPRFVVGRGPRA